MEPQRKPNIQKLAIYIIGGLVIFYLLLWISGFSYIEVSVENYGGGDATYSITNQATQDTQKTDKAPGVLKKMVRRGSYEIALEQNGKTHYEVVEAKGFFRTTKVNASLEGEKDRQFVGENPSPCMGMLGQVLVSYACGGAYKNFLAHIPATNSTPSYISTAEPLILGPVEGLVKTKDGQVVIVKAPSAYEAPSPPHAAYALRGNLKLLNPISLPDMRDTEDYTAITYQDGFITYNSSFDHVLFYSSVRGKPKNINPVHPSDESLSPYKLTTSGETIAIAYSSGGDDEIDPDDPDSASKANSTIVLQSDGNSRQFSFDKKFADFSLCGANRLCTLHNETLEIFDISGNEPKFIYRLLGVKSITKTQRGFLVVRDNGVLSWNINDRSGYTQYGLGDFTFCGLQEAESNYIVCMIDQRQNRHALYINTDKSSDNIDKKISELMDNNEVKNISVYRNRIFITPAVGEPEYQADIGGFGYNQREIQTSWAKIQSFIRSTGIDTSKYQFINSLR